MMSNWIIATALWLHALATVIFVGHFILLAVLYLPVFMNFKSEALAGEILSGISKRSRSWLYSSLGVLILTGVYLTFTDPEFTGIGKFNNPWTILMLVKHLLIVGMVVAGFWFNFIQRIGQRLQSRTAVDQVFNQFRFFVNFMAICGGLVILLTAISQMQ